MVLSRYRRGVPVIDPKTYLWKNLCLLMGKESPTVDSVVDRVKHVGRGTIQRIKEGQTAPGTDVLCAIANAFGLEVWQLLVPGLEQVSSGPPMPSPEGLELATQFDEIEDRKARIKAFAHCMTAIVAATPGGQRPTSEAGPSDQPTAQQAQASQSKPA